MSYYTHLHGHGHYSLLDGVGTAKQYAARAAELGQGALALTDHGSLSGALHHISACTGKDRKGNKLHDPLVPISGVEAYFRPDRALAKKFKQRKSFHLCLYAKNLKGWHNLLSIVSTSYAEVEDGGGFYDDPCVDWELLERHREGLACSSACISSWISHLIQNGESVAVDDYIDRMLNLFGEDFWLEIMPHAFDQQVKLNQEIVKIAQTRSIPLLATNDAHFPYKEWGETHRVAKILGSGSSFSKVEKDLENGKASYLADLNPTLYLAHEEEMRSWFQRNHPAIPENLVDESIKNTELFTQRITPFLLDKTDKLPKVSETPQEAEAILRAWIEEGLQRIFDKYPEDHWDSWPKQVYRERIESEWKILKSKGVIPYFCLIGDVVRWAKSQGIRCGIGRGSAAASLISYLVGIVTIDPISWNLLFERFLNPERKGLPDIDLDFQSNRRHEVKAYLARRYGQDHVADIITHTTFQPKKVIQDLCRVHDHDITYTEAMAVTDSIEIRQDDEETTLEEILPLNDKLREFAHSHPKIWEHALRLEGGVANNSKHAAGIIVTPRPVHEYMSLERGKAGDLVTSWSDAADFPAVSDHGLVKLDALGLIGLEKHDYACRLIHERHGIKVDLNDLPPLRNPWDVDEEVLAGFREGHTSGIFQFSGKGITALIRDIQPSGSALDLAAANAIYRPGPMKGNVTWEYAKRKNGTSEIVYWHELVTPVLEETYQLICYQEQCMSISKQLGGFSGAEADDLRKAIGKLYRIKGGRAAKDFMNRFESKWYEGCASRGISKQVSKEIWSKILEYGHYGFPRPHAAAYALTAYQDMWLKVKYPAEFYAALFTYEEDEEKRKAALREAKARGIEIVWPDVNHSGAGYTVDQEGRLVLGLASITGIGPRAGEQIIQHRPYQNFVQFLERSGRSSNTSALIHSGAVDSLAPDTMTGLEFRAYLLSKVKKVGSRSDAEWEVWEHLKHNQKLKSGPREVPLDRKEPSNEYLLHTQAEILGMPLFSHSLSPEDDAFLRGNVHAPDEIHIMAKGSHCIAGGHVTKIVRKKTKKGDDFANVTLEFDAYQWNVKFWQGQLNRFHDILQEGRVIMVSGKKDEWNGQVSVIAQQATALEALQAEMSEA